MNEGTAAGRNVRVLVHPRRYHGRLSFRLSHHPDAHLLAHATSGIEVLEDLYGSVDYKTHLAQVFAARALKAALAAAA